MRKRLWIFALILVAATTVRAQDSVRLGQALTSAEAYEKQGKFAEALKQYDVAFAAAQRIYKPGHRNLGVLHGQRGDLLMKIGEFAKAKPDLQAALQIFEQGNDVALKAEGVNNLATACVRLGEYAEARGLHERGFQLMSKAYGPESPQAALSFGNLAGVYREQGRDADAEAMIKKEIVILAKAGDQFIFEYAHALMSLANVYQSQDDFVRAEPLYLSSIGLLEKKFGPRHFEVARVRNNLALLYSSVGQYERAEAEQRRVLEFLETALGKDGIDAARSRGNLAALLYRRKNYGEAERLFRETLAVREAKLGPEHPDVAITLSSLGLLYADMSRPNEARAMFERTLEIKRKHFGAESAATADGLSFLGGLALREQKTDEAARLLRQAAEMRAAVLPAAHPDNLKSRIDLGNLAVVQGRQADALREFDAARKAGREFIRRTLPALSDSEQLTYLREIDEPRLHAGLGILAGNWKDRETVERTAEWVLNGKGTASEAVARRALVARDNVDPKKAALNDQLAKVRKDLAALWQNDKLTPAERNRQSEALGRSEQELTKALGSGSAADSTPWVDLAAVREKLSAGDVWIDILRVRPTDYTGARPFDPNAPGRYFAWITPHSGPVKAVDLGPADAVDNLVKDVRKSLENGLQSVQAEGEAKAETTLREELDRLAALVLRPLLTAAGDCKRVHLSPDGWLWLVPWAALPVNEKQLLIEKVTLQYAGGGRDLVAAKSAAKAQRPILFADPDYDLAPADVRAAQAQLFRQQPVAGTPAVGKPRFGAVQRLQASAWEAAVIQPRLQEIAKEEATLYSDKFALETTFKRLQRPRFLLVSTHGYFQAAGAASNPLLNCGLLLAGCNKPPAQMTTDLEDGVLTGLEILGADLRGTELVVLAACETGLGAVRDGQGVAGLRQAFQLAGANSVVSTLWEIPDKDSALIMNDFFLGLAAGKNKAEALQAAQLKRIESRREKNGAAHPFYWAAWTLTGE